MKRVAIRTEKGVPVKPDAFFSLGKLLPGESMEVDDEEAAQAVEKGVCVILGDTNEPDAQTTVVTTDGVSRVGLDSGDERVRGAGEGDVPRRRGRPRADSAR